MKFYTILNSITGVLRGHIVTCVVSTILVIFICYALTFAHGVIINMSAMDDDYVMLKQGFSVRGPALSAEVLAARVERLNAERRVRNAERFPAEGAGVVLAVRAGRGAARLQRLLLALAEVTGIETALLVVSHSFYDDKLNTLVRSVRFCRVLQIFYPHSRQLFPDSSPGADPADSPDGARGDRAEHKQHWWWTAHFLFNHYLTGKNDRLVLFLQEDDYVAPDLLYMLQYAQRALAYHSDAEVISLGRPLISHPDFSALTVEPWRPPYDRGLAFNHSTWRQVEALAALYCAYDDASWSYSLLNVFAASARGHVSMVASVAPRVLAAPAPLPRSQLFPPRVHSVFLAGPGGRAAPQLRAPPHGNGGWDNPRAQLLCLDPFLATTTYSVPATSPDLDEYNTTFALLI